MTKFAYWKACVRIHIQSSDWKLQGMIEDGYTSPTKNADHKIVPKPHFKWDKHKFALANLNSKAISCIINGLTFNEFHKVINITCGKEI